MNKELNLIHVAPLGADAEAVLNSFIEKIRSLREEAKKKNLDLLHLCKEFEDSGTWRLYGTWTFQVTLREKCGMEYDEYRAYRSARNVLSHDEIISVGMDALRKVESISRTLEEKVRDDQTSALTSLVLKKIEEHKKLHGFSPTKKAAIAIVEKAAKSMGLLSEVVDKDKLSERYNWLVSTLEQIESLSDEASPVGVLARNALKKVGALKD